MNNNIREHILASDIYKMCARM